MIAELTRYTQKQLQELAAAKAATIHTILDLMGPDNDLANVKDELGQGDTAAKLEKFRALMKEQSDIHDALRDWEPVSKARQLADEQVGFKGDELPGREKPGDTKSGKKSISEQFVKSLAEIKLGKEVKLDIDLKAIMQTGAGWAPETIRLPRVELYPLRALRVADIFPTYPTGRDTIAYMEETTHTNNAAEIAEETNAAAPTAFGEAALALTERTVPVEKIATWIPVSEEQLADVEGIGSWIENRLRYMVGNRLDGQLMTGNGTPPNLRGVNNASNVQSQAKGTDPTLDAIMKGITKVRGTAAGTGFAEPSHIVFHPNDWESLVLTRTADGLYILGNPTDSGPERVWGVPRIVTSAATENTATLGDFVNYCALHVRNGIELKWTDSHGDLFTAGVMALRAIMRCAAVYYRGSAFCKVTGI